MAATQVTPGERLVVTIGDAVVRQAARGGLRITLRPRSVDLRQQRSGRQELHRRYAARRSWLAIRARHKERAACQGCRIVDELDLSAKRRPRMDRFTDRIPAYRNRLIVDLGITNEQVDHLIDNRVKYRERLRNGTNGYRLLVLQSGNHR